MTNPPPPTPAAPPANARSTRILSGIQPTGKLHLGNYFGAIRQYVEWQHRGQAYYFLADLHALTTVREPRLLQEYTRDAATDLLALGVDPQRAVLFRQSDVPEVTELMWLLMTVSPLSLLEKCHAYKDKVARGIAPDAGLFTYPALMAADILAYDSDLVPVGADQLQHIEVTRDMAQRFNSTYGGEFLHLPREPKEHVLEESAKVVGTDGEKMSKSYNNTIQIFETEKALRKKIMSMKTDSTPVEAPKNPDTCAVFTLYKLFAAPADQDALAARYRAGGMGYGEAKQLLFEAAKAHFQAANTRRAELVADPEIVERVLQEGADRARQQARAVLQRVRSACGLRGTVATAVGS